MASTDQELHLWSKCSHCGMNPTVGPSFRCASCPAGPENDLCDGCYRLWQAGKVRHPAPGVIPPITLGQHQFFQRMRGDVYDTVVPWLRIATPRSIPPSISRRFLIRPEFCSRHCTSFGSYAFAASFRGHPLLLTALHVIDEFAKRCNIDSSARNAFYSGAEIPQELTTVILYDASTSKWMFHQIGEAGPMLVLKHARTGDEEPAASRDIAAFHLRGAIALEALPFADKDPSVGDSLWLAARSTVETFMQRAVCVAISPTSLIFRYDAGINIPLYSSGAAILNDQGHIVGINVGIGRFEGCDFGCANPLMSIRAHLTMAL